MYRTRTLTTPRSIGCCARAVANVGETKTTFLIMSYTQPRKFSTTPSRALKQFFPEPDAPSIRTTEAAWPHPVYTKEQMESVVIAHREAKTWSDWTALAAIRTLRWGLDLATGYKHDKAVASGEKSAKNANQKHVMTARKYMIRNVFLESVAGVPGMVAGMLRHLHSMRRMKRDNGWIETLLEESYNER
ncbi:putative alternative oxidase, partial [Aureobasidium melanogenum]